ncbi:hypothetical protein BU15DRAFT_80474 [Melanogaster broomeanus]|nr:hypothetical protein BU15DRAFT_80474 [Melanogaster broomeanus]
MFDLVQWPFIIMEAGVGHPAPGVLDQPSFASFVWSYDQQAMCYEAFTAIQPPRLETIENLRGLVKRALTEFGQPTRRIAFFRDGLSEVGWKVVVIPPSPVELTKSIPNSIPSGDENI